MTLRLNNWVRHGELDNRMPGRVTGRLWLVGSDQPIYLDLEGNAMRDLAGCQVRFTHPAPVTDPATPPPAIERWQEGQAGEITASRKARVSEVPLDEVLRRMKAGEKAPEHIANCLYVEWFDKTGGRILAEIPDCHVELSAPAWQMTDEQQQAQRDATGRAVHRFIDMLLHRDGAADDDDDEAPETPSDEFAWERMLRESDKRTDRYMAILEKYGEHPDREKLVAREMGWRWVEEVLEAQERGFVEAPGSDDVDDEVDELEPLPETEGVDWVRDKDGEVEHPLVLKARGFTTEMWQKCEARGLIGEGGDQDLHDMVSQAQITGAKLAGALNSLAYGHDVDGGFVVAYLKRALSYLHLAIGASDKVRQRSVLPESELDEYRRRLFDLREGILKLMDRYRQVGHTRDEF